MYGIKGIGADDMHMVAALTDDSQQYYPSSLASSGLEDPPPGVFLVAVSIFTLTTILTHVVHENDRPRSSLLVAVAVALLVSSMRQCMAFDEYFVQSIQYSLLPGIAITLVISSMYNKIWMRKPRRQDAKQNPELPLKTVDHKADGWNTQR